jgi:hypothetical protein
MSRGRATATASRDPNSGYTFGQESNIVVVDANVPSHQRPAAVSARFAVLRREV